MQFPRTSPRTHYGRPGHHTLTAAALAVGRIVDREGELMCPGCGAEILLVASDISDRVVAYDPLSVSEEAFPIPRVCRGRSRTCVKTIPKLPPTTRARALLRQALYDFTPRPALEVYAAATREGIPRRRSSPPSGKSGSRPAGAGSGPDRKRCGAFIS
jgi:hypothetical protein